MAEDQRLMCLGFATAALEFSVIVFGFALVLCKFFMDNLKENGLMEAELTKLSLWCLGTIIAVYRVLGLVLGDGFLWLILFF